MIRRRIIGVLLLAYLGLMVIARNSNRLVKPKGGTEPDPLADDGSPALQYGTRLKRRHRTDQPKDTRHPPGICWPGTTTPAPR